MNLDTYYNSDAEKKRINEMVSTLISDVESELSSLNNLTSELAIQKLVNIQKLVLPTLLNELKSPSFSLFRTRVIDRFSAILNNMLSSTIKLREFELKEEIDFNNPKVQMGFSWLIEVFGTCLDEEKIDKGAVFTHLASKLVGWEDTCNKKLSKLSLKAIQQGSSISNPLLDKTKA